MVIWKNVRDFSNCTHRLPENWQRRLQLLSTSGPLEFIAMEMLEILLKTENVKQQPVRNAHDGSFHELIDCGLDVQDRNFAYCDILSGQLGNLLWDPRTCSYKLRDEVSQPVFPVVLLLFSTKNLIATLYHQQTRGEAGRFNKRIICRLQKHLVGQQRNWDVYVQPLTYAYNAEGHRSTNLWAFSPGLSCQPSNV